MKLLRCGGEEQRERMVVGNEWESRGTERHRFDQKAASNINVPSQVGLPKYFSIYLQLALVQDCCLRFTRKLQ